jgi:hypothetical protein
MLSPGSDSKKSGSGEARYQAGQKAIRQQRLMKTFFHTNTPSPQNAFGLAQPSPDAPLVIIY